LSRGNNNNKREIPGSHYVKNEKIKYSEIRVIEGLEPGIYETKDALREAEKANMDLILISEKANPPVCKIVDFSKFLYEEKQRQKELKDKTLKIVVKEVQFTPNIGDNDYEVKKRSVIKFLEKGNKVKAIVIFKGRNIMFKDRGELILAKLATEIEDHGIPEEMPKLMGKNMSFTIKPRPKK
jgi:translation initiation factor IF-3